MSPVVVIGISVACSALFIALDLRDAGFRASWSSDRARLRRNAAFLVSNLVTMAVLNAITRALAPHFAAAPHAFRWDHEGALAVLAEVGACLLVAELVNWLAHWAKHEQPWLWRFHLQHHVETRYSVNLTLHTHGVEVVFTGVLMGSLLALFGFSRFAVDVFTVAYFATNLYKHCSARLSLGPLDWIIVGPAYHRLHHARGQRGNYGSVLTLFDVLFRTARFPTRAELDEVYRLPLGTDGGEPFGYLDEMLAPFVAVPARARDP